MFTGVTIERSSCRVMRIRPINRSELRDESKISQYLPCDGSKGTFNDTPSPSTPHPNEVNSDDRKRGNRRPIRYKREPSSLPSSSSVILTTEIRQK